MNLYRYCVGDPVNYRDPSGMWAWFIAGGVIGGLANGIENYRALHDGRMSKEEYWKSVGYGATTGALTAALMQLVYLQPYSEGKIKMVFYSDRDGKTLLIAVLGVAYTITYFVRAIQNRKIEEKNGDGDYSMSTRQLMIGASTMILTIILFSMLLPRMFP